MTVPRIRITIELVEELIAEQFPQWTHLRIRLIEPGGWDNKTFRLGSKLLVRLPSAQAYEAQVKKEHAWLPYLAPNLSYAIPGPVGLGCQTNTYPFKWSVYHWIEGNSANTLTQEEHEIVTIAQELARFLNELQKIDTIGGPLPGTHNFYRGGSLSLYDSETRTCLADLERFIPIRKATMVWEKALSTTWQNEPVWLHGDMSGGNIIIRNDHLAGVIDFGCMAVGDPACDLVSYWTIFSGESSRVFKEQLALDQNTWDRARGWALWKALISCAAQKDISSLEAQEYLDVINKILND